MNSFYEHHKESIRWQYRCFDRILLNGLIQPFQQPERVVGFFNTYRQLYPVTRHSLRGIAEQFQRWVKERAEKRNIPIVEAPKGRRDEFRRPVFRTGQTRSSRGHSQSTRTRTHHDCHRRQGREPMAPSVRAALGRSVQLLHQRPELGTNVRTHLPLPSILSPYLPQPASLAGKPHARARHRIQAVRQCLLEMLSPRSPARTRRLTDPSRSGDLWPKMADAPHAILHRKRTRACRLPAPAVLLSSRVLRQPHLPSPCGARQYWRTSA